MIDFIINNLGLIFGAIGFAAFGLITALAHASGKKAGVQQEQAKQAEADNRAATTITNIRAGAAAASDDDLDKRFKRYEGQ